ncbi:MAG TPA: hypothetical protein VFU73_06610 [Actinocrinis sp.]|nr:hypothetical protein [Actinocrinis sp.]
MVRRLGSALAALAAIAGLLAGAPRPAAADVTGSGSDSAVTLSGSGPFSSLKVTVSQTQNLINQDVGVSWSGGVPTVPASGVFYTDYLQIMECWGDDTATGPDPSQCEFGPVRTTAQLGGTWANTRQLTYPGLADPAEADVPAGYAGPNLFMPFAAAPDSGVDAPFTRPPLEPDVSVSANFYDQSDTDEVDYARTDADGTGHEFFQIDTGREAPGLGCGASRATDSGGSVVEPCWLVVVPRGHTEVDGSARIGTTVATADVSSPLSAANWAHRIAFELTFQPVTSLCTIGAHEVQVVGDEQAAEAMSRWQPGLCQRDSTSPYSYSQIGDDQSRSQLASGSPGLALLSNPMTGSSTGATNPSDVLYAPVAVNALTISFSVQSQGGTGEAAGRDGVQIAQLNLNARLVAKLLTQSYQAGVGTLAPTDVPAQNPLDLTADPEFLALNPQFKGLNYAAHAIPDVIVPFGNADAYAELWTWIDRDPAARSFLNGIPDTLGNTGNPAYSGMVVNPNYLHAQLPIEDFPTTDPYCQPLVVEPAGEGVQTPLCGIALHPYSTSMHQAALAATEGNQLLHVTWGQSGQVWGWVSTPAESDGDIGILALADAATAAKYDLPTARLCDDAAGPGANLDQDCKSATADAMLAAVTDAVPSAAAPTVLIPDPVTVDPRAYPLTTITYAATVPTQLPPDQAAPYANLLDYVAGPGQVSGLQPGDLALGYAPLPPALVAQTQAAATILHEVAAGTYTGPSSSGAGSQIPPPLGSTFPLTGLTGGLTPPAAPALATTVLPLPPAKPGTVTREKLASSQVQSTALTAPAPLGAARYVLFGCLLLGAVCLCAGRGLLLYARRLSRPRAERRGPARFRRGSGR